MRKRIALQNQDFGLVDACYRLFFAWKGFSNEKESFSNGNESHSDERQSVSGSRWEASREKQTRWRGMERAKGDPGGVADAEEGS
jgi:hypothetical protein